MKILPLLCATVLFTAGCATKGGPTLNTEGPRSPLANPADNTLNSPVTGPSGADEPGSSIGTSPAGASGGGLGTNRR